MIIDKSRRQVYNPINQIGNCGYCDAGAERRLLRKINGVVNMARIPRARPTSVDAPCCEHNLWHHDVYRFNMKGEITMKVFKTVTDLIGNTPLLELSNYEKAHDLNFTFCLNTPFKAFSKVIARPYAHQYKTFDHSAGFSCLCAHNLRPPTCILTRAAGCAQAPHSV